jgi:hypothetical protein
VVFVTADVLSEEVILKWYKEGHSVKGKMLFLDQMKKFIEWLQNAEEGECDSSYLVGPMVKLPCL